MTRLEALAKQKVLAVYPEANEDFDGQTYWIWANKSIPKPCIATGKTSEAAWQNAAESQTEQETMCLSYGCTSYPETGRHYCKKHDPVAPVETKEKPLCICNHAETLHWPESKDHFKFRRCSSLGCECELYVPAEPKPTPSTPSPKLPAPAEPSNNSLQLAEPTLAVEEKAAPSTPADAGSDGIGWCSSCDKIHEVARPKCPSCGDWLIFAGDDGVSELAKADDFLHGLMAASNPIVKEKSTSAHALIHDLAAIMSDSQEIRDKCSEHGIVERIGWEGIAGAIIDKVNMTPEDYVNEELVEQLKRYFVPKPRPDSFSIPDRPSLSEAEILSALYKYLRPEQVKTLVYSRTKDGIDCDYVTVELNQLVNAIISRLFAAKEGK